MYAAEARNPDCIQPLIDYGAAVGQSDTEGQTPLHYAAKHHADLAYYRPLIEAGADPNCPTIRGTTPLATAICDHHAEAAEYLIEHGADIDRKCQQDRPPLFYAVEYNNHFALETLLKKGAKFDVASEKYPTIVHAAARFADVKSLHILTTYQLAIDNLECVDFEGLSVLEIINWRLEMDQRNDETFVQAFGSFLRSIKMPRQNGVTNDEDEFHDTLENLHD
jgi:ankyrin repeat protein